jgi:hypothetical protein
MTLISACGDAMPKKLGGSGRELSGYERPHLEFIIAISYREKMGKQNLFSGTLKYFEKKV